MKLLFTEEEVKTALKHFIESEDGLGMSSPYPTKEIELKFTYFDERASVNQVEIELVRSTVETVEEIKEVDESMKAIEDAINDMAPDGSGE